MADVVVIGGGILGATVALHLAEAGARVVLVEREPALGTQTTAAGAGFVGYWAGELEAELAEYGMRFYTGLSDRIGADAGVRRVGLLFPALSEPGVEMLRQEHERELAFAPGVAMIEADEAARMAPILSADAVHGALLQPDGHRVDTVRVMAVLTGELERAGVDVRTGVAAERAIVAGGRVAGVRTSAGDLPAGAVVNAAGAAARAIGARNGVDIAAVPLLESRFTTEPVPDAGPDLPMMLFFERDLLYLREQAGELPAGAVVNAAGAAARAIGARNGVDIAAVPLLESRFTTEPVPGAGPDLPMMLFFERDLLYVREQAGGLLVGAIEHAIGPCSRVDLADPPRAADLSDHAALEHEALARELADVIPALATARVRERASGLPTWTPDGRHILGTAPEIDGYVVLAGCNECCVTHGPGLARIAAELVTAGGTETDMSAYRVDRFAETSDDAIQAAAESQYLMRHPPEAGVAATPFGIGLP